MLSDNKVRDLLHIGYRFMFKGESCTVTGLRMKYFEYSTMERPCNNRMYYGFFQTIPHFRGVYKPHVGKQSSLKFEYNFLPLVERVIRNRREKNLETK